MTSYLVSPQSCFTCPPSSLRWRPASSKTVTRYTYVSVATGDSVLAKREIRLFREETLSTGNTVVACISRTICSDSPIVHIFTSSPRNFLTNVPGQDIPNHDLIIITANGSIFALNGETLEEKWQVSPSVLSREILSDSKLALQVDFVQQTSAADVADGLFGGKNDLFGVFQERIHRDGFNPDFFVVITSQSGADSANARHLHVLALPSEREARQTGKENIISVFVAPLAVEETCRSFQLDVRSGTLQAISNKALVTYQFANGIAKLENRLQVPGLSSYLRLSKTSVLTSATDSLSVYNPIYRSLQATARLEPTDDTNGHACEFVSYLASRELAVAIRGGSLVVIQIEAPKNRTAKRRAEGLLTDAIRRGISREIAFEKRTKPEHVSDSTILADAVPGSLSDPSWSEWQNKAMQADELLQNNDIQSWEELMAEVFKVPIKPDETADAEKQTAPNPVVNLPEWEWPSSRSDYARVDRRWVVYAINKVFGWEGQLESNTGRLTCRLPESSVLNYLVDAGHLSTSNVKSAFKDDVREVDKVEELIGEQLPIILAEVDPTMELLVGYLSGTQLGSSELVSSIKLLLCSLGLFEDGSRLPAVGDNTHIEQVTGQENEVVNMELDRAEEELQITEHYLDEHRTRGLGIAFSKLAACPAAETVKSLRRLFKPDEVLVLLNVLRAELIKDGWTTRYLDKINADQEDDAPPDASIQLIADLMSRCIDAVGLSGWMAADVMLSSSRTHQDSADFFSQFQAEISVALEGVMEAVRLKGVIAEAANYAKRARRALADSAKGKAMTVHMSAELPLGLKTDNKISTERVRSGGEIVARSSRQIGHFISKRRGIYSIHRISEEMLLGAAGPTVVQEAR